MSTVAIMGPRFGFVLETVLITPGWGFPVAEQHLHSTTSTEDGVHENLGGHTPGIGDPSSPKGYPHTIWCIAQHIELWKRERGDAQRDVIVAPNTPMHGGALLPLKGLNTCLLRGSTQ